VKVFISFEGQSELQVTAKRCLYGEIATDCELLWLEEGSPRLNGPKWLSRLKSAVKGLLSQLGSAFVRVVEVSEMTNKREDERRRCWRESSHSSHLLCCVVFVASRCEGTANFAPWSTGSAQGSCTKHSLFERQLVYGRLTS
jgi:hypothetical protein